MALNSMTGFATYSGAAPGAEWVWEARSVNARGLDIRLRLPEGLEALEPAIRAQTAKEMSRGSISISLKVSLQDVEAGQQINEAALVAAVTAFQRVADVAQAQGLALAPVAASDLLAQRGVVEQTRSADRINGFRDAIHSDFSTLLAALRQARADEGVALVQIMSDQIDRVDALVKSAEGSVGARSARNGASMKAKLDALLGSTDRVDEDRLAQEMALIAVKSDVTEEIDRLKAHVASARDLLNGDGAIGRKLDFLMQEFNREANTLCSKSGDADLTAIGLELKVVIDQMREQCQNVE